MKQKTTRFLVKSALIAALYTVLTLVLAPISYGNLGIEFRVSEALTILPIFTFSAVPGLFIGCIISNLIGMTFSGLGIIDVVFGSLASLIAALLTYYLRDITFKGFPLLSFIPPIIVNALIVGLELSMVLPEVFSFIWAFFIIGIGQLVVLAVLGTPFYFLIKKTSFFKDE